MKKHFKILPAIILLSVLFNACKKDADFESIDPNLVGSIWRSYYTRTSTGASALFYLDDHMEYKDKADGSSIEDDVNLKGAANYKNGIIYLWDSKFKIEEYPIRFDTAISYDIQSIPTHWRMKMKRVGNRKRKPNWDEYPSITFYRE